MSTHHEHHSAPGSESAAPSTDHGEGSTVRMAASATLHCLTGCAIGEIAGLIIGTAAGLGTATTVAISVTLAFVFGYALSTLPLLRAGLAVGTALSLVLAADTLSILTMEIVDNLVMVVIPGAMDAGLVNPTFWISMMIALTVAFLAAFPLNRYLLQRGKGHALTHHHHGSSAGSSRPWIPAFSSGALAAVIAAFMLGGLLVSVAADTSDPDVSRSADRLER